MVTESFIGRESACDNDILSLYEHTTDFNNLIVSWWCQGHDQITLLQTPNPSIFSKLTLQSEFTHSLRTLFPKVCVDLSFLHSFISQVKYAVTCHNCKIICCAVWHIVVCKVDICMSKLHVKFKVIHSVGA
jgi:hypothetical protein